MRWDVQWCSHAGMADTRARLHDTMLRVHVSQFFYVLILLAWLLRFVLKLVRVLGRQVAIRLESVSFE